MKLLVNSRIVPMAFAVAALSVGAGLSYGDPEYGPPPQEEGFGDKVNHFFQRLFTRAEAPPPPAYSQARQSSADNSVYSLDHPPAELRTPVHRKAPAPVVKETVKETPPSPEEAQDTGAREPKAETHKSLEKSRSERGEARAKPKHEPAPEVEESPPEPVKVSHGTRQETSTHASPAVKHETKRELAASTKKADSPPDSRVVDHPRHSPAPAFVESNSKGGDRAAPKDSNPPPSPPAAKSGEILKGTRIADKPGRVRSPYPPFNELDVSELPSGSLAQDPTTSKVFRVP